MMPINRIANSEGPEIWIKLCRMLHQQGDDRNATILNPKDAVLVRWEQTRVGVLLM